MSAAYPLVPLGEVLTKSKEQVEISPHQRYKQVTIKLWGQGVVLRDEVVGAEIAGAKRFVVRPQQFILSRIDARNGAFGLVPDLLDGAVVSNDFPTFASSPSLILPDFLGWMSKTRSFVDLCRAASEGTTNRVRLKEDRFMIMKIPLPPLSEQRRIVARIEELAARIEEARGLRRQAVEEAEALIQAARRTFTANVTLNDWVPLSACVQRIENGWSPSCENRPATEEEWGVLKVGAVSFGKYNATENKALPAILEPKPEYEVSSGDFLMSRANTKDLVGACAIVEEARPRLMLSDKIFRFVFKEDVLLESRYLSHVLKSPALRSQIENGATGTSPTMKNISKGKVLNLLLPRLSLEEQRSIVAYLDSLQAKVDSLKQLQAETAAELDALLPSVLDRAFKGKL